MPMTPEELLTGLRTKYPQYKNIPDTELLPKLVAKYPQYQKQLVQPSNAQEPSKIPENDFIRRQVPEVLAKSPNVIAQVGGQILRNLPYQDYKKTTTPEEMTDVVLNASPMGVGGIVEKVAQRSGLEQHILDLLKKGLPIKNQALAKIAEKDPIQAIKSGLSTTDWPKVDKWLNEVKRLGTEGPELDALIKTKAKCLIDEINGAPSVEVLKGPAQVEAPKQIVPAVRDPQTGQVYTGPSHNEIMASVTDPNAKRAVMREVVGKTENTGFLDVNGQFINRMQAQEKYGFSTSEELATKVQQGAPTERTIDVTAFHGSPKSNLTSLRAPAFFTQRAKDAEEYVWGLTNPDKLGGDIYKKDFKFKKPLTDVKEIIRTAQEVGVDVTLTEHAANNPTMQPWWEMNAPILEQKYGRGADNPLDLLYIPKVRKALREKGFDAVMADDPLYNYDTPAVIPLLEKVPVQSTPNADPFFLKSSKILEDKNLPSKASGQGWINLFLKKQVKPDELKWSGLDRFLKERPTATKEEVQQYIKENSFNVTEINLGGIQTKDYVPEGPAHYGPETHLDLQIPGAIKHEETLYQLPNTKKGIEYPDMPKDIQKAIDLYDTGKYPLEQLDTFVDNKGYSIVMGGEVPILYKKSAQRPFQGGHYDEPNILAHVLRDEIKIGNDKVSLLNEKQSDWHQRGSQEGYGPKIIPGKLSLWLSEKLPTKNPKEVSLGTLIEANAPTEIQNLFNDWMHSGKGVPDAPFKKNWNLLIDKREIRRAVERKQDGIAWPAGEVIADRYNLSNWVSKIDYVKNQNGTYDYALYKKNGDLWKSYQGHTLQQVKDHIGSDVMGQLQRGEGLEAIDNASYSMHGLKGKILELKNTKEVGGEWHKKMYDEKFVNDLNAFVQPFGAKMEKVEYIGTPKKLTPSQKNDLLYELKNFIDEEGDATQLSREVRSLGWKLDEDLLESWADFNRDPYTRLTPNQMLNDLIRAQKEQKTPMWYLKFTPALKRAALKEGFPLFMGLGAVGLGAKEGLKEEK